MTTLESAALKKFPNETGPFVKGLDNALKSFNVDRTPYYGGTFIGNHVHRSLKVLKYV